MRTTQILLLCFIAIIAIHAVRAGGKKGEEPEPRRAAEAEGGCASEAPAACVSPSGKSIGSTQLKDCRRVYEEMCESDDKGIARFNKNICGQAGSTKKFDSGAEREAPSGWKVPCSDYCGGITNKWGVCRRVCYSQLERVCGERARAVEVPESNCEDRSAIECSAESAGQCVSPSGKSIGSVQKKDCERVFQDMCTKNGAGIKKYHKDICSQAGSKKAHDSGAERDAPSGWKVPCSDYCGGITNKWGICRRVCYTQLERVCSKDCGAAERRAKEEAVRKAEEAAERKAEEAAEKKRAEEAAEKKRAEEAAEKKRAEEAAKKKAEEEAVRKAEEAAERKAEEAAEKKAEEALEKKEESNCKDRSAVECSAESAGQCVSPSGKSIGSVQKKDCERVFQDMCTKNGAGIKKHHKDICSQAGSKKAHDSGAEREAPSGWKKPCSDYCGGITNKWGICRRVCYTQLERVCSKDCGAKKAQEKKEVEVIQECGARPAKECGAEAAGSCVSPSGKTIGAKQKADCERVYLDMCTANTAGIKKHHKDICSQAGSTKKFDSGAEREAPSGWKVPCSDYCGGITNKWGVCRRVCYTQLERVCSKDCEIAEKPVLKKTEVEKKVVEEVLKENKVVKPEREIKEVIIIKKDGEKTIENFEKVDEKTVVKTTQKDKEGKEKAEIEVEKGGKLEEAVRVEAQECVGTKVKLEKVRELLTTLITTMKAKEAKKEVEKEVEKAKETTKKAEHDAKKAQEEAGKATTKIEVIKAHEHIIKAQKELQEAAEARKAAELKAAEIEIKVVHRPEAHRKPVPEAEHAKRSAVVAEEEPAAPNTAAIIAGSVVGGVALVAVVAFFIGWRAKKSATSISSEPLMSNDFA